MGGKGSNVFDENPPDRQKLAAEGSKPDFRVPFLLSRYTNSFCFQNSFLWAAVSTKKLEEKCSPSRVFAGRSCDGKSNQNGSTSLQSETISVGNSIEFRLTLLWFKWSFSFDNAYMGSVSYKDKTSVRLQSTSVLIPILPIS